MAFAATHETQSRNFSKMASSQPCHQHRALMRLKALRLPYCLLLFDPWTWFHILCTWACSTTTSKAFTPQILSISSSSILYPFLGCFGINSRSSLNSATFASRRAVRDGPFPCSDVQHCCNCLPNFLLEGHISFLAQCPVHCNVAERIWDKLAAPCAYST